MKLNEFEEKLATVSDAKLRQMLTTSRATGPDVAVNLILSECKRRGMDGLDAQASPSEARVPGSETTAYPQEHAGHAGADAPPRADIHPPAMEPHPLADSLEDAGAPATAPDWLNEESKTGVPVIVKVLLVLVVLGGMLGLAWKFSH